MPSASRTTCALLRPETAASSQGAPREKHYTVDNARLYALPDEPIEVVVAAGGPEAAKVAARAGDGLVSTSPDPKIVSSYRREGGVGTTHGMLTICWAESEEEARRTALEWWPNGALEGTLGQELPLPSHFEQAAATGFMDFYAREILTGVEELTSSTAGAAALPIRFPRMRRFASAPAG